MSNYSIQKNWGGVDALPDSDPEKVISGNHFDTEFTAVQTAINSKAELTGSNTQAFNAATAAASTNNTQVATTEYVTTAVTAAVAAIPSDTDAVGTVDLNSVSTYNTTIYINDNAPSGGSNGDIWFEY